MLFSYIYTNIFYITNPLFSYDVKDGRPILADWMNRVQIDLQPHYDDIHKALYKMREKFGIKPESKL